MRLLLISGFLGSGKTTLVIRLAHAAIQAGQRVAVVVNEIGEIGVDDQVLRQHELDVFELLSGCICCTLSVDLISTLQKLDSEYAVDLVIVEASGAADPRGMLSALPYYKGTPLESVRSLVLLDPTRLEMLMEVLTPLITSQIQHAHTILISKADLASAGELAYARRTAEDVNPEAAVISAAVKDGLDPGLVAELLPWLS
jgi:G3E family GTPase